ncbi:MAG: signal peptide peptidase SppA [Clostridia bacterium]|nr:signal peptide peptidase SppA [Clostridia bacterium]
MDEMTNQTPDNQNNIQANDVNTDSKTQIPADGTAQTQAQGVPNTQSAPNTQGTQGAPNGAFTPPPPPPPQSPYAPSGAFVPPTYQAGGMQTPYGAYTSFSAYKAAQQNAKKKKKRIWPFVLLGVVCLFLFVFFIAVIASAASADSEYTSGAPTVDSEYVAVLYIDDEISGDYVSTSMYGSYGSYNQVYLINTIYDIIEDENNCGLMLYINSPGGEVTATDELACVIEYYKEQTHRPVYAYFGDYAASGAYWIGSFADYIVAHKFCTTGSIGVTYGTHIEISELLSKLGIKATELTAGDNKAMGSMYSPLTDEQEQMYRQQLDEIYQMFIDVVCENRDIEESKLKKIADGRTFLASQALEYGLIDEIGYYADAQNIMAEQCDFSEDVMFIDCYDDTYYSTDLLTFFYQSEQNTAKSEEELLSDYIAKACENRRFMVLYEG